MYARRRIKPCGYDLNEFKPADAFHFSLITIYILILKDFRYNGIIRAGEHLSLPISNGVFGVIWLKSTQRLCRRGLNYKLVWSFQRR